MTDQSAPGPVPLIQPGHPGTGTPTDDPRRIRRAVLAATGEARNDASEQLTDAVALMVAATEDALGDHGDVRRRYLQERIGLVCAMVGTDDSIDPAGAAVEALGLRGVSTMVAAVGVPQQRLVSNAVLAVETGAADAVLVLGGEAKASALGARRGGTESPPVRSGPGADHLLVADGEFMAEPEVAASLWDPVTQYALIDSALARHEGLTPTELRHEVSVLWERFDAVAGTNPDAAFAGPPHSADGLATTTEANRLLAFPYNKWHSTQWALDHAAALLVCAEEVALGAGADPAELLHPQVALDSSFGLSLSRRSEPHRWPTIGIMGEMARDHLGSELTDLGAWELYSCFPAAVRVQQRELHLPPDGTPTVTGGMAFAGGPFNHFTFMATAALARHLRSGATDRVALTTVSGMLTKGGLMVWGREPHPRGALVADVAGAARSATAAVDVAPFDPSRSIGPDDEVLAATITGGFDPRLFALVDDEGGVRRLIRGPAPHGDPAEILTGDS